MELTEFEEKILDLLKNKKKNMTFKQIKRTLNIFGQKQLEELVLTLKNLEMNGYLYLNDYDEYTLFSNMQNLVIGELRCNVKNKPYVVVGHNNIFIPDSHLNGAIAGDIVIVKRNNYKGEGNSRGVIDKILKRNKGEIIFDYIDGKLVPYNWPFPINVKIPEYQLNSLIEGNRILIKLSLDMIDECYEGTIISYIGQKDDPDLNIKTIASKNGIIIDFSKESLEQAKAIKQTVSPDEIARRVANGGLDLREEMIFTIDGANTKDIDDAVSIKKLDNGHYMLGVHIADVSYYVPKNTPLDLEARERSTSYYPYIYAIPMLPPELSSGICSLNPNVDRLAFSCIMEIDKQGEIVDFQLVDTIINSKKKMVYEELNDIFERHIPHHEYDPYLYDLSLLAELSEIQNHRKDKRGYLCFGDNDVNYSDDHGNVVDITLDKRGMFQKAIENAMLLANECVASFSYWLDCPANYRNHQAPDIGSIKQVLDILNLKIRIPNNVDNPRVIQNILHQIQQFDEGNVYSELLLQSMKRAYCSPNNKGHFGLALPFYTWFTSPIRRYIDLDNHRNLRQIRDDILSIDYKEKYNESMDICKHATYKEKIADITDRDIKYFKMAEFMSQHIGEHFTAYVSFISKSGITVKTDNLIVGKIDMDILKAKGFVYDNKKRCLTNSKLKQTISIGDSLEVKLIDANTDNYRIEFTLLEIKSKQKVLQKII